MVRVLVVDDSDSWRDSIRAVLIAAGHHVVGEASDGLEALACYELHRPELVTLDIQMPHLDGVGCLQKLRETDPQARVVMVSGMGSPDMRALCGSLGAAGFVQKPFQPDDLELAVREALL